MQVGKRQLNLLGVLSKDNLSQTILKFTDKTFLNQQNVQKTFQQFVRKIVWKQNNGWTESFIVRSEHKNHLRQIAHWAMPNEIFENPHFALNMTLVHKITFVCKVGLKRITQLCWRRLSEQTRLSLRQMIKEVLWFEPTRTLFCRNRIVSF